MDFITNVSFVNEMYLLYIRDKNSIPSDWHDFFKNISENELDSLTKVYSDFIGPSWTNESEKCNKDINSSSKNDICYNSENLEVNVQHSKSKYEKDHINSNVNNLTEAYKRYGHLYANIDPIKRNIINNKNKIDYVNYGICDNIINSTVIDKYNGKEISVFDLIKKLNFLYCNNVGVEFDYLPDDERDWLDEIYNELMILGPDSNQRKHAMNLVMKSESFEQFMQIKFPGTKRFSIEGSESSLVVIESVINTFAKLGTFDVVLGMSHRGRLNALANICNKPYYKIIQEFINTDADIYNNKGSGDVKYHNGYSCNRNTLDGIITHISLTSNPSHLESVNSVVIGRTRAKQDMCSDFTKRDSSASILVHGDASMSGQGSVSEVFNMSNLDAYHVGGTVHIVINNMIGFTTDCDSLKSGMYCTDIAKTIKAPVFHVNGDDVDACYVLGILAAKYREKFKKDIIIDVVCYRKHGHNELDEPMYTQPVTYKIIKDKTSVANLYKELLIKDKVINNSYYENDLKEFKLTLENEYEISKSYNANDVDWLSDKWTNFTSDINELDVAKTGISLSVLKEIGYSLCVYPDNFNINKKIKRQLEIRRENINIGKNFDWSLGELLSYGSLLKDGHIVRFSGQDVERGTFSHRHCVITDNINGSKYNFLKNIPGQRSECELYNSCLSEFSVLGFEYGYSITNPDSLTIWEAQFGDFANCASVIFDQFISSSESKWFRLSGLVMLLPHGFDGQGPEHSSARIERYLQSCANNNIIVANCTTPSNMFHIIRRQVKSKTRKPLILMTPKSLLRHKMAVSNISDFTEDSSFKHVIDEIDNINSSDVEKIIITSGKIYYELYQSRLEIKNTKTAIIRIEQYYPFPIDILVRTINKYKNAKDVIWVQEEPYNMGAWSFIEDYLYEAITSSYLDINKIHKKMNYKKTNNNVMLKTSYNNLVTYVGRCSSSSPATGYLSVHNIEQNDIMKLSICC